MTFFTNEPKPTPGGTGWDGGGAGRGEKLFLAPRREARCRRDLGVLGPARRYAAGPRPLPGSPCPAPRRLAPGGPAARARSRGSEAGRDEDADAERGRCLPARMAQRLRGSPRRRPGALLAAGCRRPRRLEGAALTVARGRLNPLLALPWAGEGVRSGGHEPRRTPRARPATRLPGPPLAAARPAPHPQQFTCWSLASG